MKRVKHWTRFLKSFKIEIQLCVKNKFRCIAYKHVYKISKLNENKKKIHVEFFYIKRVSVNHLMFKSLKWNVVNQDNEIISSHETKQEAIKSMNEIESSAMLEQNNIIQNLGSENGNQKQRNQVNSHKRNCRKSKK